MSARVGLLAPNRGWVSFLAVALLAGCGTPEEATRVEIPVVVDDDAIETFTTDLGYVLELTEVRIMVRDLTFALQGETHEASLQEKFYDLFVKTSWAHPGHSQGGDVTGELRGRFLLDWLPGDAPAPPAATLLTGSYRSANFIFSVATEDDGFQGEDELLGHSAILRGRAELDDAAVEFLALIDSPEDRELTGIPFEVVVEKDRPEELRIQFSPIDEIEGDTLFDGLDFVSLDDDQDGQVTIASDMESPVAVESYNLLRRTLQTHDHYAIHGLDP